MADADAVMLNDLVPIAGAKKRGNAVLMEPLRRTVTDTVLGKPVKLDERTPLESDLENTTSALAMFKDCKSADPL